MVLGRRFLALLALLVLLPLALVAAPFVGLGWLLVKLVKQIQQWCANRRVPRNAEPAHAPGVVHAVIYNVAQLRDVVAAPAAAAAEAARRNQDRVGCDTATSGQWLRLKREQQQRYADRRRQRTQPQSLMRLPVVPMVVVAPAAAAPAFAPTIVDRHCNGTQRHAECNRRKVLAANRGFPGAPSALESPKIVHA